MPEVKTASSASAATGQAAKSGQKNTSGLHYNVALGYLRAFIIVLVVAYHAVLNFHLVAPPFPPFSLLDEPPMWRFFPVVDGQHSIMFSIFMGFNDIFFMSLMFFLSGLFVWKSLQRKGGVTYLRDRLVRLGLPFIVMIVLVPFTYYPTYLQIGGTTGLAGFWQQWKDIVLSLHWLAGPAWFIWLLLAFDCIVVFLCALMPKRGALFDKVSFGALRRPASSFGLLVILSAVAYIPLVLTYDPNWSWWSWGPFAFQTSRIFLYMVFFMAGVLLGAHGIERTLLVPDGMLARRWIVWVGVAIGAFILYTVITIGTAPQPWATRQTWATVAMGFTFVLSCAASSFACMALFLKFARKRRKIFDSLAANGYGIYVIHWTIVSWLLFILLKAPLSAIAKGAIVFVCALALCWAAIAVIRRIPVVARVI
jgi:peptidoglycan/LPS O-acetylase OafA/YrhL